MNICIKRILNTLFIFILFFYTPLFAQNNLMKEVTIGVQKPEPIARLLKKLSDKQNFYFAYNNQVIPADSLVSISGYNGTLLGLLEKMLGQNYEFKEVPGYIVLRYAPRRLFIMAEAFKDGGAQNTLKGYVRDVSDKKSITGASVYEKNLLLSVLTDERGYFELKLKNYTGPVMLTVSKENYRDTSMYMLPDVVVNDKSPVKKYKYYPDNATGSDLEHSGFARFFISSKQLLQGLNVGNFFVSTPYQLSLVPGLSTHGLYNSQVIDHFSLNLIGGYTAGVDGVELAGVFNINRKDMRFMQIAPIFNFVGGNTKGVQIAGLYNQVLNNAAGFQFAGLANNTGGFTGGFQFAGLVNKTKRFTDGLQFATLANIDQQAGGVQIAGLTNTAVNNRGVAIAGLANIARDSSGIQTAGLINKGGYVSLLQVGFMNIAKKVRGVQVGFINVADSSDYAVGVINIIKNGEKSISLSTDQSFFTHADFRSGGRVLYGLIGLGYQPGDQKIQYALDVGAGARIVNHEKFFLNTEYAMSFFVDFNNQSFRTSSARVFPGYKLNKHWGLFAGPAINFASADRDDALKTKGWVCSRSTTDEHINTTFIDITGGVRYSWF